MRGDRSGPVPGLCGAGCGQSLPAGAGWRYASRHMPSGNCREGRYLIGGFGPTSPGLAWRATTSITLFFSKYTMKSG